MYRTSIQRNLSIPLFPYRLSSRAFSETKKIRSEKGTRNEYDFKGIDGNKIKLEDFKDKVIVIVNVASRCGYTPQYEDLQELWSNYKERNLVD